MKASSGLYRMKNGVSLEIKKKYQRSFTNSWLPVLKKKRKDVLLNEVKALRKDVLEANQSKRKLRKTDEGQTIRRTLFSSSNFDLLFSIFILSNHVSHHASYRN